VSKSARFVASLRANNESASRSAVMALAATCSGPEPLSSPPTAIRIGLKLQPMVSPWHVRQDGMMSKTR